MRSPSIENTTVSSSPSHDALFPPAERQALLEHASRLALEAQQLHDKGRYKEGLHPAKEALLLRERLLGSESLEIAESLTTLGALLHQEIQFKEAHPLLDRALRIREAHLSPDHPLIAESLTNVARVLYAEGQFSRAQPLLDRAVAIREQKLGTTHPDLGVSLVHLSIVQSQLGDLPISRRTMERALRILEPAEHSRPLDLAMGLNYYGNILRRQGEFAEARPPLERSLSIRERILGPLHPHVARTLARLGSLTIAMGDPKGGLPLLERALEINRQALGPRNAEVAGSLNEIGRAKQFMGDFEGARTAFEEALSIQEEQVGSRHPFVAITLNALGQIHAQTGNAEEARDHYTRALRIQEEALGANHPFLSETLTNLGYLEGQRSNFREAEQYLARSLALKEKAFGSTHPDLANGLFDLARAKHAIGNLEAARSLYERARMMLLSYSSANQGLDEASLGRVIGAQLNGLYDYELLLASIAQHEPGSSSQQSAAMDGFLVAEQARSWLVQAAVARAMARQTLTDTSELEAARQLDDLRRRRQHLWARLSEIYGQSTDKRAASDLSALQSELDHVQQEFISLGKTVETQSPRYAELALPKPVPLSTLQSLLKSDEALISWFTLPDRILIWCLRQGASPVFRQVSIARPKLESLVTRLRTSLTPIAIDQSDQLALPPFDVDAASKLYHQLFGSVAPQLNGVRHLVLIPDKVLLPIPFAALLENDREPSHKKLADLVRIGRSPSPQETQQYKLLPWLAASYSLTVLPSGSTLNFLRQGSDRSSPNGEPFIGFGDPVLGGKGKTRGGAMLKSRGQRALRDQLNSLSRLPGTREELRAVATALTASPEQSLFLDEAATETTVRQLNKSGRLGRARVIAFATHGLLAGELEGLSQPALVLTPPAIPTEQNDGLLSLEEILQLQLPHTDWVILSACNTAGGDGSGESLSGLARAFFFAGAKGLLVSQWSVDDRATQELMTQIFQRYGAAHSVPPAEALQQGMLALLQLSTTSPERAYFAHPFAWASFFLVGDGSGPLR